MRKSVKQKAKVHSNDVYATLLCLFQILAPFLFLQPLQE